MIVYLAGFKTIEKHWNQNTNEIYILSSFWEHKSGNFGEYVLQEKHILDSGAYSAINDKTGKYNNFDWDNYVKKYIAFIKYTKQKLFFELDIDCVIGLNKVEYYRKQIEDAVGIQPIPVWHSNRKAEYFYYMCENYPYVALGTTPTNIDGKKIRSNPEILNWFINIAKKNKTKIHGLGFTSQEWLPKLKFDSVDSTTWLGGARYGHWYWFNGKKIQQEAKPKNTRVINGGKSHLLHIYNFNEWIKFQKYALNNL